MTVKSRLILTCLAASFWLVRPANADLGPLGLTRYVAFVARPAGMSHSDFMTALMAQAMKAKTLTHPLDGLVVSDVIAPPPSSRSPVLEIDAMVEFWTHDEADYAALLATPDGKKWRDGMEALYGKDTTYVGREHLFTSPNHRGGTIKAVSLLVRKDGWSHADFLDHWVGIHGVMATKVPGLVGFVLTEIQKTAPPKGDILLPENDGIAEMWWETPPGAAPGASVQSDYANGWYKDGNIFIQRDKSRNLSLKGNVVIPVSE